MKTLQRLNAARPLLATGNSVRASPSQSRVSVTNGVGVLLHSDTNGARGEAR